MQQIENGETIAAWLFASGGSPVRSRQIDIDTTVDSLRTVVPFGLYQLAFQWWLQIQVCLRCAADGYDIPFVCHLPGCVIVVQICFALAIDAEAIGVSLRHKRLGGSMHTTVYPSFHFDCARTHVAIA